MSDKTLYIVYAVSDRNRFRRAMLIEAQSAKDAIESSLESGLLTDRIGGCGDTVEAFEVLTSQPSLIYTCRGELIRENEMWNFPNYTTTELGSLSVQEWREGMVIASRRGVDMINRILDTLWIVGLCVFSASAVTLLLLGAVFAISKGLQELYAIAAFVSMIGVLARVQLYIRKRSDDGYSDS